MRVRSVGPEDCEAVRAMAAEYLKEESAAGALFQPGEHAMGVLMGVVRGLLLRQLEGAALLAEEGETPLGFTLMYFEAPRDNRYTRVARTVCNYVRPEARRGGVATELIEAKERAAANAGCEAMLTTVRLANEASMALVQRAGYTPFDVTFVKALGGTGNGNT